MTTFEKHLSLGLEENSHVKLEDALLWSFCKCIHWLLSNVWDYLSKVCIKVSSWSCHLSCVDQSLLEKTYQKRCLQIYWIAELCSKDTRDIGFIWFDKSFFGRIIHLLWKDTFTVEICMLRLALNQLINLWFWHVCLDFLKQYTILTNGRGLTCLIQWQTDMVSKYLPIFYLVDWMYHYLTWVLATLTDQLTKIDCSFVIDQKSARKDVEWWLGVLFKLKFKIPSSPINLHHQDDIHYIVMTLF